GLRPGAPPRRVGRRDRARVAPPGQGTGPLRHHPSPLPYGREHGIRRGAATRCGGCRSPAGAGRAALVCPCRPTRRAARTRTSCTPRVVARCAGARRRRGRLLGARSDRRGEAGRAPDAPRGVTAGHRGSRDAGAVLRAQPEHLRGRARHRVRASRQPLLARPACERSGVGGPRSPGSASVERGGHHRSGEACDGPVGRAGRSRVRAGAPSRRAPRALVEAGGGVLRRPGGMAGRRRPGGDGGSGNRRAGRTAAVPDAQHQRTQRPLPSCRPGGAHRTGSGPRPRHCDV
ncbi:MAG: G/U mismatch-specific uracil DNA glycosylase, partial [uncultured Acidimicrobiales bacterium]